MPGMDSTLAEAIKAANGQEAVARACNVSRQAVAQWRRAPPDHVITISRATGYKFTPHAIRPDLYPHPDDGLPVELRGGLAA